MLLRRGHNRYLVVVATFFLTSLVCFYNGGSLATFREFSPSWGGASSSRSSSSSFKTSPKSGSGKTFVTAQKPLGTANVELVVATTKKDNVTWLHDYLLDLPKNLYVVDDPSAPLTVPKNKGREAMVILTYAVSLSFPLFFLSHSPILPLCAAHVSRHQRRAIPATTPKHTCTHTRLCPNLAP